VVHGVQRRHNPLPGEHRFAGPEIAGVPGVRAAGDEHPDLSSGGEAVCDGVE
jgi:hypothetical protein